MNRPAIIVTWTAAALLAVGAPQAWAIQPSLWAHTTEADFDPGEKVNTVVTNLGDVKLAVSNAEIAKPEEDQATICYDIQELGGELFLAAGPDGRLMRCHAGRISEVQHYAGQQVFTLDATAQGELLIGVSGAESRLDILTPDGVKPLAELPAVRYVWDMVVDGDRIFVATGTEGKLLMVEVSNRAEPKITELLDAAQANLICLGRDGKGDLYVGTDTDGLVYRVTLKPDAKEGEPAAESFVLYDAAEPEIGALLVLSDGTVFAGTADAEQARPGRLEEAATVESGRPGAGEGEPAHAPEPPAEPAPAEPPGPGDLPQVPPEPEPRDQAVPQTPSGAEPQAQPQALRDPRSRMAFSEDGPGESADAPTPITPEQRDRLRQVIRAQLEKARQTGALQVAPRAAAARRAVAPTRPATRPGAPGQAAAQGNAIYRIGPDGFVAEVFRESVMILRIVPDPADTDRLLVATGNEGQIFRLDVRAEETTIIADLEPQQTPAVAIVSARLLGLDHDRPVVLLGTANPATLVRMDDGYAQEGTYTSVALDAGQVSLWGKLQVVAHVPRDTGVGVQTRSGNVQDPEQAPWSPWSDLVPIEHDPDRPALEPVEVTIASPPARFIQYRLTLRGDTHSTSVVDRVQLAHVTPNLKPAIQSVKVTNPNEPTPAGGAPGGAAGAARGRPGAAPPGAGAQEPQRQTAFTVEWEATDPNNDKLTYTLEYRAAGSDKWLPLAKDLTDPTYEWQTLRVPDGRYVLRVTASDAPDNTPDMAKTASRDSDPIVIDNTPPAFHDLSVRVNDKTAAVTGKVTDRLSPVARVQYALDQTEQWQPVLPDDLIYDSTTEMFSLTISGLAPGQHVLTLRASDARNNTVYEALLIEVK